MYRLFDCCRFARCFAPAVLAAILCGLTIGLCPPSARAQGLTLLYAFTGAHDGANPYAAPVQAADGNLYGTTDKGGANGTGTIFRITTGGALRILYSFSAINSNNENADGANPQAGLVQASDGNLYGTARNGGANATGTIFKITPGGAFTTIYSFGMYSGSNSDGAYPMAGLVQAADGNLYGTASQGGSGPYFDGWGTVFKITTAGVFTTLHSFDWSDGFLPEAGLVQAADGNLYGTTYNGGANGNGTIFKITTEGVLTTLYSFSPATGNYPYVVNADGTLPVSGLVQGSDGDLYGTAYYGGANTYGTIFKITTAGVFTTLHSFDGSDGRFPAAGLVQNADGSFYGTAQFGGADGWGTIFKVTVAGAVTTVYSLDGADGAGPLGGVIQAADGNLYGTAHGGGSANGYGTVFQLTTSSSPPAVAGISPGSAAVGSADITITVTGDKFISGATVLWNGLALATTYVTATQLAAVVPASDLTTAGQFNVTVVNPAPAGGTSGAVIFTVGNQPATLTSLSLSTATAGAAAATLTLTGTGFVSGAQVMWNGVAVKTTYISATKLTATIPASDLAAAGTFTITVVNPGTGGVASDSKTFTVDNPIPAVASISPTVATAGASSASITVSGSKFVSGAAVQWNGVSLTTNYVSSTKLTATVPASAIATAGTFGITVVNPGPGGGMSKAVTFTVNNPAPALTSIGPNSATTGSPVETIGIAGAGFVSGSKVRWNGASLATTYVSTAQLTATIPAADMTKTGAFSITVFNPTPGGGTSKAVTFTVANPSPALTGISPNVATAGGAATKITLIGSNFVSGAKVEWNGAALAAAYVSATSLTATVPASDLTKAGTFKVTVANPTPGGGGSSVATFTVNNPIPTLTVVTPNSVKAGSAATKITLTGANFVSGTQAMWNGSPVTTAFVSGTKLTATLPANALTTAGTFPISVANPSPGGGTSGVVTLTVK